MNCLGSLIIWLSCSVFLSLIHFVLIYILFMMLRDKLQLRSFYPLIIDGSLFFFGMALCGSCLGDVLNNLENLVTYSSFLLTFSILVAVILMVFGASLYVVLAYTNLRKSVDSWDPKIIFMLSSMFCSLVILICGLLQIFVNTGAHGVTSKP